MASEVTTKKASLPIAANAGISQAPARDAASSLTPGARSFSDELAAKSAPMPAPRAANNAALATGPAPIAPRIAAKAPAPLAPRAVPAADVQRSTPAVTPRLSQTPDLPRSMPGAVAPRAPIDSPKTSSTQDLPRTNAALDVPRAATPPDALRSPQPPDTPLQAPTADAAKAAPDAPAIKQIATGHRADVDNTPVVAFLTGHLERLDPSSIPVLVTGNEFLGEAMSAGDVGQFMNKTSTVGELLDALDLPDSFVSDLTKLGLDLEQSITPSDLFRALGVDPARAVAELKSLKANIETGGLGALVKRAQAAQATAALPNDPSRLGLTDKAPLAVDPTVAAYGKKIPGLNDMPRAAVEVDNGKPKLASGVAAAALSPQAAAMAAGPQMQAQQPSMASQQSSMTPAASRAPAAALGIAGIGRAGLNQATGTAPTLQRLTAFDAQQLPDLLQVIDPSQLAQVLPDAAAAPQLSKGTFDSFALMGDRLKAVDTQVFEAGKNSTAISDPMAGLAQVPAADPQASSLNQMIQDALRNASGSKQMPSAIPAQLAGQMAVNARGPEALDLFSGRGLSQKMDLEGLAQTVKVEDGGDKVDALSSLLSADSAATTKAVPLLGAVAADFAGLRDSMGTGRKVSADDLKLAVPVAAGASMEGARAQGADLGGHSNERDSDQKNPQTDATDKFAEMMRGHAPGAHGVRHGAEALSTQAKGEASIFSPAERLELMQKIADRAAVLSKEGGGTVRLDIGNADLGRIELAVNMTNDDRVDLRILTGSDRARDVMASELGRLREALNIQQVQLGKVEVGVNGRPANQNFGGFAQNFNQQQNGGFQGQREAHEAVTRILPTRRSINPAVVRAVAPLASNQNGRIQIRA